MARINAIHEDSDRTKPLLNLIQTTGTGKTFTAMQLMTQVRSVYLLCPVEGKSNQATNIVLALIRAYDECLLTFGGNQRSLTTACNALAVAFLRQFEKILYDPKWNAEKLHNAQFSGGMYLGVDNLMNAKEFCATLDRVQDMQLSTESKKRVRFLEPVHNISDVARELFPGDISKNNSAATALEEQMPTFKTCRGQYRCQHF